MPLPTALKVTWEVISGDGVTIASPDALETDVTFSQAGVVVLQVTVDDGEMKSKAEIVNVGVSTAGNAAPTVTVATAGFTATAGETISVSATAGDDGNPVGSTLTYTWSVITGEEANVTIVSPDQLDTDVTISKDGVYTLQIMVTDGELIATEVVVVETWAVSIAPVLEPALKLYPNPVSGILNLELQNTGEVYSTVKLFNFTGQAVFNAEIAQSRLQIDVWDLDAGLYIITVNSGEHVFTERILIVK